MKNAEFPLQEVTTDLTKAIFENAAKKDRPIDVALAPPNFSSETVRMIGVGPWERRKSSAKLSVERFPSQVMS